MCTPYPTKSGLQGPTGKPSPNVPGHVLTVFSPMSSPSTSPKPESPTAQKSKTQLKKEKRKEAAKTGTPSASSSMDFIIDRKGRSVDDLPQEPLFPKRKKFAVVNEY